MEIWKDIEEFKGLYQVSNYGRVRSLERYINTRTYPSQIIKPLSRNNNNIQVGLRKKGHPQVHRSVASLVLKAFVGPPPKWSKQAKHLDGDPNNNRLENLEWDIGRASKLPENEKARKCFVENAEKVVNFYIKKNNLYSAFKFGIFDIDDYRQECLIRIWRDIDAFNGEYSFYTFCAPKCIWVFNRMYAKYKRKTKCIQHENEDKKSFERYKEFGYLEVYDREDYNG